MSTTAERARAVIAEQAACAIEQAADDKHLEHDLCFDSLDRYELTLGLEDEFGILIPDEEAGPLKTVGEVLALVERKVEGGVA